MEQGYFALVLHAHLPYVRHLDGESYLENRWLFEALTETYIPLLQVFQGLVDDGVDFRVTMSLSPTLVTMLNDPLLQKRYLEYLDSLIELAKSEVERTQGVPEANCLSEYYLRNFMSIKDFYHGYSGNLITVFKRFQNLGKLEIITCTATHAFLPLVLTPEGIRAQVSTAVDYYRVNFDRDPKGIWLPECGYTPILDQILKEFGFEYFFVDSHALENSNPTPVFGTLSPVLTPSGLAAFPRDRESSRQVWSSTEGYPGDFDYREYYRDIGYDLELEYIRPYIHPDGIRHNTGIKYFRITGQGKHKELYNREWARAKAAQHAENFLQNRQKQVEYWSRKIGRKPIVVSPYDAELFGHWWYEGPMWIDILFRKLHYDQDILKNVTPSEYLRIYSDYQVTNLPMSSWGRGGLADVWLRGENDWIYPALHQAEQQMIYLVAKHQTLNSFEKRILNQAARELMLAQSSDWAFIMDNKTMVDYALKRTKQHVNRFFKLTTMLQTNQLDRSYLENLEQLDNIFPEIDYSVYQANNQIRIRHDLKQVLILSWEFPPLTVGGLSRHVYDLTRFMAGEEWEIHVVTSGLLDSPEYEMVEGVHVHRVSVSNPHGEGFMDWVLQLNLAMLDTCQRLSATGIRFSLIHAHDWIVCYAAKALKQELNIPLVATIHATEHGRNNGIFSDLQRSIHKLEWDLTYEAEKVIVCSKYMEQEVSRIFELPPGKILVIPNGIDPKLLRSNSRDTAKQNSSNWRNEKLILFIGRMVREKGIHILLEAAPQVLESFPEVSFVCAGNGPMFDELKEISKHLGIEERVSFPGYVTDEERNRLFAKANVAVFPSLYEPFGIVALEAMATGTPVVVSDIGGLSDVVEHGRNGLKVYAGNPQSLADQIKALLSNPLWASGLARTALSEIGKFNWQTIVTETLKVYNLVTNEMDSSNIQENRAVVNGL